MKALAAPDRRVPALPMCSGTDGYFDVGTPPATVRRFVQSSTIEGPTVQFICSECAESRPVVSAAWWVDEALTQRGLDPAIYEGLG